MCEISFMFSLGGKIGKYDISQLLKMMKNSTVLNDDGFGFYNGTSLYKSEEKYDDKFDKKVIKKFTDSNFIMAHTRYATTGEVKLRNSHPFENERFVWLHNGIIHNFEELKKKYKAERLLVDSEIIGFMLKKHSDNLEMKEALEKTMNELEGSVSVFIYDKVLRMLYYARAYADFTFRLIKDGHNIIIGNTDYENLQSIYKKAKKKEYGFSIPIYSTVSEMKPKQNIIYQIDKAGLNPIGECHIKAVKYVVKDYSPSGYGSRDDYYSTKWTRPSDKFETELQELTGDKNLYVLWDGKLQGYVVRTDNENTMEYLLSYMGIVANEIGYSFTVLSDIIDEYYGESIGCFVKPGKR